MDAKEQNKSAKPWSLRSYLELADTLEAEGKPIPNELAEFRRLSKEMEDLTKRLRKARRQMWRRIAYGLEDVRKREGYTLEDAKKLNAVAKPWRKD